MSDIYDKAFALILNPAEPKRVQEGLDLLHAHLKQNPNSNKALFELAGAYDCLGQEATAANYYQKVQKMGVHTLPADDQPCFYVQYGSTLRNLKKYAQAEQTFQEGLQQFPNFTALQLFKALNDYSRGQDQAKNKAFLEQHLKTPTDPSVVRYQKSLKNYLKLLSR